MSKNRTEYSDIFKAKALAALDSNGGNVSRTARELKIPRVTLIEWRNSNGINEDVTKLRQEEKETLAELLEEAARETIKSITQDIKDGKGELQQKSITAAILLDKHQLLTGRPTARNENIEGAEYNRKVDDLRGRRELRKVG